MSIPGSKRNRPPKPVPAQMEIFKMPVQEGDEPLRTHRIDNIKSSASFLHRTVVWAISEGHGIQISRGE